MKQKDRCDPDVAHTEVQDTGCVDLLDLDVYPCCVFLKAVYIQHDMHVTDVHRLF